MKRKIWALILAAVMLAVTLVSPAAAERYRSQAGSDVSGFDSHTIYGESVGGDIFTGYSVSIVTYWATWSGPALAQLDYLQQVHARRPDIGVFGILYTDSTSTASAAALYMTSHGYTFPVFTADSVWQGVLSQAAFLPHNSLVNSAFIRSIETAFSPSFPSLAAAAVRGSIS